MDRWVAEGVRAPNTPSFSTVRAWPETVKASDGINGSYLYWYQLASADDTVLPARLAEAAEKSVIPVLPHYQLLNRGRETGFDGDQEWDVVIQAAEDAELMRAYFESPRVQLARQVDRAAQRLLRIAHHTASRTTPWAQALRAGSAPALLATVELSTSGVTSGSFNEPEKCLPLTQAHGPFAPQLGLSRDWQACPPSFWSIRRDD